MIHLDRDILSYCQIGRNGLFLQFLFVFLVNSADKSPGQFTVRGFFYLFFSFVSASKKTQAQQKIASAQLPQATSGLAAMISKICSTLPTFSDASTLRKLATSSEHASISQQKERFLTMS